MRDFDRLLHQNEPKFNCYRDFNMNSTVTFKILFVVDIDDCVNVTCSGKGNCSDRTNGSVCECQDGFYGLNCEIGEQPVCLFGIKAVFFFWIKD